MSPAALVMPGPRPACQGLSVSRVITVCDPAFASVGSPHHGTASEQLRIICLHTVCVRPARRPSGHCHARPSARVSSTGLETQGPEASLLLLQRNLVYAPLRSAHHRGPSQLAGSFFSADRQRKNCPIEISFIPRGEGFFGFFCRLRRWGGRHPAPTRVPLRVCGTQTPASEMGTGNSASHLRVCRTNLDG